MQPDLKAINTKTTKQALRDARSALDAFQLEALKKDGTKTIQMFGRVRSEFLASLRPLLRPEIADAFFEAMEGKP